MPVGAAEVALQQPVQPRLACCEDLGAHAQRCFAHLGRRRAHQPAALLQRHVDREQVEAVLVQPLVEGGDELLDALLDGGAGLRDARAVQLAPQLRVGRGLGRGGREAAERREMLQRRVESALGTAQRDVEGLELRLAGRLECFGVLDIRHCTT